MGGDRFAELRAGAYGFGKRTQIKIYTKRTGQIAYYKR
jgi:hypothetical protein